MRDETAIAQKRFWTRSDVKPIWVTIVSAGILVGFFLLHQRLVPNIEENIYVIFYNASSFFGISFVVVALAALRPRQGVYHSYFARLLWGSSVAHFAILFMCIGALVYIDDPRALGPLTHFSLLGVFYSIVFWLLAFVFALASTSKRPQPDWLSAGSRIALISLSPLVHIPLYFVVLSRGIALFAPGGQSWGEILRQAPQHVVFYDPGPLAFTSMSFLPIAIIMTLATGRRFSHRYALQLAGLFLLIHALFSYVQIINALVAKADASLVAPLFGETTSAYAVVLLVYLLLASKNVLLKLPALNGRSLLIALASTICAYFAFVLVAPPRALIFGVIPLILLAALLAYLSNLEGTIKERTDELAEEKEKTEGLLANILPQYVVEELKEKGTSTPKVFDEVAVMFTDFVGFTTITQKLPPKDLIKELNTIFTRFDEILEQHQSERIKTIGDAYMCVSGLSASNTTPASNLLRISREMLTALKEINEALGTDWQIRIGVASGNCIGGIVGTKKYQFDLFGDTVNTAARMEAYSSPGCVNIDAKTYEAVCNEPSFIFKARPLTAVKGKGDQQMFFVEHTNQTPDR